MIENNPDVPDNAMPADSMMVGRARSFFIVVWFWTGIIYVA
ncbi:hypothetical protein ACHMW4_29475 [Mesorhizobium sp. UC22_110]